MKTKAMNQAEILEKNIKQNAFYQVLLLAQNAGSLETLVSQIESLIKQA